MSADLLGWLAAALTLTAFSMRTMRPLRMAAVGSNVLFIGYGLAAGLWPVLVLHLVLLPFNLYRLSEVMRTAARIEDARRDGFNAKWIDGAGRRQRFPAGTAIFRKGDPTDYLYVVQSGTVHIEGVDARVGPGEIFGEIGFFTEAETRTLGARAETDVEAVALDAAAMAALHYQHPEFGAYLNRVITRRLLEGARARPEAYALAAPPTPPPPGEPPASA